MSQTNPSDDNSYKCAACIGIFKGDSLEFYEYNGEDDYEAYCKSCNNKNINNQKIEREKLDEEYAFYIERIVVNTKEDFVRKYCYVNNYDVMFEEFEYAKGSSDSHNILEEIQRRFIEDIASGNFEGKQEKIMEIAKRISKSLIYN
jgi:hypothetical protein